MKQWLIIGGTGLVVLAAAGVVSTYQPTDINTWATTLPDIGSSSSPRLTDLTGDGILDIILGAGRQELQSSDTAVIALDGASGELLWQVAARDQIVGSALLYDITGDGIEDVFIGGRRAELMAIDGARGNVLWEFYAAGDTLDPGISAGLYNFYNPQRIPDQDGDGRDDLLVANGGDYLADPDDPNRPTGRLMVMSSQTGTLLAQALVPDGRETYLSAVVADLEGDGTLDVVYGTGGETFGGHLYRTTLTAIMAQDIQASIPLATGPDKGFIAPPVLVDLTGDDVLDIVANSVDGRLLALQRAGQCSPMANHRNGSRSLYYSRRRPLHRRYCARLLR